MSHATAQSQDPSAGPQPPDAGQDGLAASAGPPADAPAEHGPDGPRHADTPTADQLAAGLEAILLAAGRAVSAEGLWEALGQAPGAAEFAQGHDAEQVVQALVDRLNSTLQAQGRAARVERLAGGYRMMVTAAFGPLVAAYDRSRQASRLSRASLETLSIIAYRQPITRAQIEAIRGVACGEVIRSLLDRKLIAIKGRAEEVGRPILYGTTTQFLDLFGLASLKDLPGLHASKQPQPLSAHAPPTSEPDAQRHTGPG